MAKVSFRMASASRESLFAYRPARRATIIGQAHRGPLDLDAKQMLRKSTRLAIAWTRQHPPTGFWLSDSMRRAGPRLPEPAAAPAWEHLQLGRSDVVGPRICCRGLWGDQVVARSA